MERNKKEIIYSFLLITIPLVLLFGFIIFTKVNSRSEAKIENTPKETIIQTTNFSNLNLEAKAVFVRNIKTGQTIYTKNEQIGLPLASLTKIMTALIVAENENPNSIATVGTNDIATDGESLIRTGEQFKISDLIDLTMVGSINDAASAIASFEYSRQKKEFISLMNKKAEEINLKNTNFKNSTGLDIKEGEASAFGSAEDVANLMQYAFSKHPEIFAKTNQNNALAISLDGTYHKINNTNKIARKIPGLLASKTGLTDTAGGNLAVIFDAGLNNPYIIVVLGSSEQGRFQDVEKIVEAIII